MRNSLSLAFLLCCLLHGGLVLAEDKAEVEAVREVYNEVEGLNRTKVTYDFSDGPEELRLAVETAGGLTRRVGISGGGDHSASSIEVTFDSNGNPRFALVTDSSWRFVTPEKTRDELTEYRLDFNPASLLVESLKKTYQGSSEQEIKKARESAKNRPHGLDPAKAGQFALWLRRLSSIETASVAKERAESLFPALELIR